MFFRYLLAALTLSLSSCLVFPDDCFEKGCEAGLICASNGECTGTQPGTPSVTAVDPSANSVESDAEQIQITFSEPMQAVDATTLLVRTSALGALSGAYGGSGAAATFTPTRTVPAGDEVEVTVRSTLQSTDGTPLAEAYVFRFRVESSQSQARLTSGSAVSDNGNFAHRVRVVDLDGDGLMEIIALRGGQFSVYQLDASGSIVGEEIDYGTGVWDFTVGDFNQDGTLDVFAGEFEPNRNAPFYNRNGTLERCCVVPGLSFGIHRIETADMNGDGIPDLVGVIDRGDQTDTMSAFVAINAGNGSFTVRVLDSGGAAGSQSSDIAAEDMNGDGLLDVVLLNDLITRGPGSVTVLFADGEGRYAPAFDPEETMQEVDSFATGDFDGDGDVDVAVGQRVAAIVTVLENTGQGDLRSGLSVPANADVIEAADMNGDGQLDIVTAGATVLLNQLMGTDFVAQTGGDGRAADAVAFGDLDGDGDVDVVGASSTGAFEMVVLLNE